MTAAELRQRLPNATEDFIRRNADDSQKGGDSIGYKLTRPNTRVEKPAPTSDPSARASQKTRHLETQLQLALLKWWHLQHRAFGVPEQLLMHIPNGGKRNASEGAILKSMGTRAGVPDLLLAVLIRPVAGLWIELKAPGGNVTALQADMHRALTTAGYSVAICRTLDQAISTITKYLRP